MPNANRLTIGIVVLVAEQTRRLIRSASRPRLQPPRHAARSSGASAAMHSRQAARRKALRACTGPPLAKTRMAIPTTSISLEESFWSSLNEIPRSAARRRGSASQGSAPDGQVERRPIISTGRFAKIPCLVKKPPCPVIPPPHSFEQKSGFFFRKVKYLLVDKDFVRISGGAICFNRNKFGIIN